MKNKELKINFGAKGDTLFEQCHKQSYLLRNSPRHENTRQSILMLMRDDYITKVTGRNIFKKLAKAIENDCVYINESEDEEEC